MGGPRKAKNHITKEDLAERLASGETQREIAMSIGVKPQVLQYYRKKWGMALLKAAVKADHCEVEGCTEEVHGKGLCNRHYKRKMINGSPTAIKIRERGQGTPHIQGYWRFKVNGKLLMRHRIIAEEMIGRQLLPGEEVHHKDENKGNDTPDNLVVCANRAAHRALHKGERRQKPNVISL